MTFPSDHPEVTFMPSLLKEAEILGLYILILSIATTARTSSHIFHFGVLCNPGLLLHLIHLNRGKCFNFCFIKCFSFVA